MSDTKQRMIIKRGTVPATVPVSADHRNGDWIASDIYEGELYQDSNGVLFQRSGSVILGSKKLKGYISQTGTNAPVVVFLENTTGVVPTTSYVSAGQYKIDSTGLFTNNKTLAFIGQSNNYEFDINPTISANYVVINTWDTSVPTNGLLNEIPFNIEIFI